MVTVDDKLELPVNLINPEFFWGEEKYRNFVSGFKNNALVNRVYPAVDRVREKKLLTLTAELGLLSALQDAGLTLSQAEAVLPAIEESGLLSFAANNAEFLLNTVGFLAVEPAELALPLVVAVVKGGSGLLNTIATAAVLLEVVAVAATKNPVIGVAAGIPLLGTAYAATYAGGLLDSFKAVPKSVASVAKSKVTSTKVSSAKVVATTPKVVSTKVSVQKPKEDSSKVGTTKYVKPKVMPSKRAAGNLSNLPKRRTKA